MSHQGTPVVLPENLPPLMETWIPLYHNGFIVVHRVLLGADVVLPAMRAIDGTARLNLWSISTKMPLRVELHNLVSTSAPGLEIPDADLALMRILHLVQKGA